MITLRRLRAAQYKGLHALDLAFPERGSVLIEGRNEAGKSTLFDAVHFALYGVPLVGDQASAIHYGGESLGVQLDLAVGATTLSVERTVRQTARSLRVEAELLVQRGDEQETVKGSGPVSRRLQQELGGLTAEALLNSCLVAQKQLGRLETLTRQSREEALTILLNLGKLSDVHGRLRLGPNDEAELRRARARVELARLTGEAGRLGTERVRLERLRTLAELRAGIERLERLQESLVEARTRAGDAEARLQHLREALAEIDRVKESALAWQGVRDLAERRKAAEEELARVEREAAEAQQAAADLPACRAALARYQAGRDQAQALADLQVRLRELSGEAERLEKRLQERAVNTARKDRLEAELEELRRRRRDLAHSLMQLAPLAAELEASRARRTALTALQGSLEALGRQREELEELEQRAAARAEAEAGRGAAAARLETARGELALQEAAQAAADAWRRRERVRDLLEAWLAAARAAAAAAATRRLMEDLALAVSGVQHVALEGEGAEGDTGLRLDLVIDHPLTGALALELRLSRELATLREVRPATEQETGGLRAGSMPALGTADDRQVAEELAAAAAALAAAGEPAPVDEETARRRLAEVRRALGVVPPDFDEGRYRQALVQMAANRRDLEAAEAASALFPPPTTLQRDLARLGDAFARAERACRAAAKQCRLEAADLDALAQALPDALAGEQARQDALQVSAGRREGLQEQIALLDKHGRERARELEEHVRDLACDSEDELRAAHRRTIEGRLKTEEEGGRLYAAAVAVCGEGSPHPPSPSPGARASGRWGEGESWSTAAAGAPLPPFGGAAGGEGYGGRRLITEPALQATCDRDASSRPANVHDIDVGTLREYLQREVDTWGSRVALLDGRAAALDSARSRATALGEALAALNRDLARAIAAARSGDETGPTAESPEGRGTVVEEGVLARDRLAALGLRLQSLDEPATRAAEQEAQRAAGAAEASMAALGQEARSTAARLLGLAGLEPAVETDVEDGPAAAAARLREACPEVAGSLPASEDLERELQRLDQQVGHVERGRQDARAALGDEAPLEPEAATQALAELEREQAARRRAQDIVSETRQRMINKVLPDTIANMCLLLPLLTAGRYRHAELTADYRLQVWDERKRGYVEKALYSGGTQDQFSLALRLGFALAALPRELGTSPGFLFLDEPLSSFDRDRTAALIDLLTHGQIATFFQQVFLISHSQAFDPHLFTHHVAMEDGRVASSTLPTAG